MLAALATAGAALVVPVGPAQATTYYGAMATDAGRGALGMAWNLTSAAAAEQSALDQCGGNCTVLTTFTACGAVSHSDMANRYTGGNGGTRAEAEASSQWDADSRVVRSVCNG
ncbi:DUF4189 domain-containing protein [Nocardia huaxiensis]|uniref:DUF4189 domain-containing protein n=1 Tax=Nocardia huaxiensis TaxID=2755382 RepID=A0A7D6VD11_9NOCA|nr:DUF4189 domain-containing protein [Nocardia huaxiensis]QLY32271.1 DUF4189 domain-containing protein [Nocardia huaxiensis]UFS94025.1 DUF4189 domain-containing protein [Nocardia huaxiensis]